MLKAAGSAAKVTAMRRFSGSRRHLLASQAETNRSTLSGTEIRLRLVVCSSEAVSLCGTCIAGAKSERLKLQRSCVIEMIATGDR